MKKIALSIVALLGFASVAAAEEYQPYNEAYIGFNNIHYSPSHGDAINLEGIMVGYNHGFALSEERPMFLEVGGRFVYGAHKEEIEVLGTSSKIEMTTKMSSLAVPVNFAWKFYFGDITVTPYSGFNLKLNMYGNTKTKEYLGSKVVGEYDQNHFKKYDLGGGVKSETASRMQFGWQIGAKAEWRNFIVGLEYEIDFNNYQKKVSTSNFSIAFGYKLPF